jgi:hypothetical protein
MSDQVISPLATARALLIGAACITGALLYNGAQDRAQRQCLAFLGSMQEGRTAAWIAAIGGERQSVADVMKKLSGVFHVDSSHAAYCFVPQ